MNMSQQVPGYACILQAIERQPRISLLSVQTCLFWMFHANGTMQSTIFLVWFLSLSITSPRFIWVAPWISVSFVMVKYYCVISCCWEVHLLCDPTLFMTTLGAGLDLCESETVERFHRSIVLTLWITLPFIQKVLHFNLHSLCKLPRWIGATVYVSSVLAL